MSLVPTQDQANALREIVQWYGDRSSKVFCLRGYAGCGKTTMTPLAIETLGLDPARVLFVAPTGKAAKVLTGKLKSFGFGSASCSTIHSAIYKPIEDSTLLMLAQQLERLQAEGRNDGVTRDLASRISQLRREKETLGFVHIADLLSPEELEELGKAYDLIVCDEASMVTVGMAQDLFRAFPHLPMMCIGDPGQLPPVVDRYADPASAKSIILHRVGYTLTQVVRQAADSPIIRIATLVREGRPLAIADYGDAKIVKRADFDLTEAALRGIQVIVGRNKTRWDVSSNVRRKKGIDGSYLPQQGEPIICTRNSRNAPFRNGEQYVFGQVLRTPERATMRASIIDNAFVDANNEVKPRELQAVLATEPFEQSHIRDAEPNNFAQSAYASARKAAEQFDFAYAITAHKSQGSEWDELVVLDESFCFRDDAAKWLYTAVTRAKTRLTVVK